MMDDDQRILAIFTKEDSDEPIEKVMKKKDVLLQLVARYQVLKDKKDEIDQELCDIVEAFEELMEKC